MGYPDDRDRAGDRLDEREGGSDTETERGSVETDETAVDSSVVWRRIGLAEESVACYSVRETLVTELSVTHHVPSDIS